MRITSIELAGEPTRTPHGKGMPRAFARLSRKLGDDHITVELILPGATKTHHVRADSKEDLWSMAQCLQSQLGAREGTSSRHEAVVVCDYLHILQYLAD